MCCRKWRPSNLLGGLDADAIVHGIPDLLFAPKIALGGLHRYVPEKELDLFEFATRGVTQTRTGPPLMPHAAFASLCRMPDYAEWLSRSSIWRVV